MQLEAMGFDRAIVLEVFFACNKNEELAANYLLDHMHEFEDWLKGEQKRFKVKMMVTTFGRHLLKNTSN